jgi:hypothetical protein
MEKQRSGSTIPIQVDGLLPGQPVPQPGSLLANVGDVGQAGRLLGPEHSVLPRPETSFRTADSRTLIVEGESDSMPARHSINKDRERGRLAQNWKRVVEGFGVVALRMRRRDGVEDQLAQQSLGGGEGEGPLSVFL